MADVFTPEERSAIMARIGGQHTKPEVFVRKIIHSLGYRFRLHCKTLHGKPDIVLRRHKKIIFVHGCFWHGHVNCRRAELPATNRGFWQKKILNNKRRDAKVRGKLRSEGWNVMVLWQCQLKQRAKVSARLLQFLTKP